MNIRFKFLLLLLLLHGALLNAQSITGYVYDEIDDLPLEGAFVYLDGTTLSANTDANGYFTLNAGREYNAALIVSFIGFDNFRVENPFSYKKPFKVKLRQSAQEIEEIVIISKPIFTRKQMLKVFREQFLGKSGPAKSCKIENEEDIKLYYDVTTFTLRAKALKPIRILNEKLKYKLQFDLIDFNVSYSYKTLDEDYLKSSFFAGTTFFSNIAKGDEADKKRKQAYLGSPIHLMRTIAAKDWKAQKFALFVNGFKDDPDEYFEITDTLNLKKVKLIKVPDNGVRLVTANGKQPTPQMKKEMVERKMRNTRFNVLYDGKDQSFFSFYNGYFFIDRNGQYFPVNELLFGGHISIYKAGYMLPADYKYVP